MSRTYTFGREGTHVGKFYEKHLAKMQLNDQPVDWASQDLGYLLQEAYNSR